jgi:tetratricopeptide (TPR) repeat protein
VIGVNGLSTIDARLETRDFLGIPIDIYKQLGSVVSSRNQQRQNSHQKPGTGVYISTETTNKAQELFKKGNEQFDQSDYQGAVNSFTEAIKLNPKYANAYNDRGVTRFQLADKQGAIEDYNQAIKINPNYADAYYNRGNSRSDLGDKEGAIRDYTQAIKINPNFAEAYGNRGIIRSDLGDRQAAIADLKKAARLFDQQGRKGDSQQAQILIKKLWGLLMIFGS